MKELLDIVSAFFERSGFFFVPILSLMALFDLSPLDSGKVRKSFALMAAAVLSGYISLGNGSARYMLIPLLFTGLLAGAGAAAPVKYLHKLNQFRWLKNRHLLLLFTVVTLTCSFLKLSLRDHNSAMNEFAHYLSAQNMKIKIYAVNCSHKSRLANQLRNHKNIDFYFSASWNDAMRQLAIDQQSCDNIYIFTDATSKYTAEDLLIWLRGKYYLAPFEVVHSAVERSRNYVLLKFNGKVLDGEQNFLRSNALTALPDTLLLTDFRSWGVCDISKYLPQVAPAHFVPGNGTEVKGQVYFRKSSDRLPDRCTLQLRNNLTWLEGERCFTLTYGTATPQKLNFAPAGNKLLLADAPPLLTGCQKLFISDQQQFIHLSGANALWHPAENRFFFTGNSEKHFARQGKFEYTVQDRKLTTSASETLEIYQYDLAELKHLQGNILILQEPVIRRTDLPGNLRKLLPRSINVQTAEITMEGESSLQTALTVQYPQGDFQVIMLNIFADLFVRSWTVPLNIDPFMDEHLTNIVQQLEKQYPNAVIALLLPPPPAPGESVYPALNSVKLSRLAHCNMVNAVHRWQQRKNIPYVEILPFYLSIDPDSGYIMDSVRKKIYSGFAFTDNSNQVMAENTAAFLIYLHKNKGKFR